MTLRCICPVAVSLCVAAGLAAGQGREPDRGLITEDDLGPHLIRLARSLDELRRGRTDGVKLLEAFPRPATGTQPRAAAIQWYARALALSALGRPRDAREAVHGAVRACRSFPQAQLMLANMELAAGDATGARRRLLAVVGLQPDCEPALLTLGALAFRNGDLPEALDWYRAAVKHRPQSVAAQERKARTLIALDQLPAALEAARAVRAIEGAASVRFYSLVAEIYLAGGDLIAACRALEKGACVCDARARPRLLRRLLGWYRLSANSRRMKGTLDRLLALKELSATERGELERMKRELEQLDEAAFLLWNFRWQVQAVRDARVPAADRATALTFLCHVREGDLETHLEAGARKELDRLWWSAADAVTRGREERLLRRLCAFFRSHPDPAMIPLLARLVHPSPAPAGARRAAVETLEALWRPALLPLLLQCLEDPDEETARTADRVLCRHVPAAGVRGDLRTWWRRWARGEGRKRLATAVDPLRSGSLWELETPLGRRTRRRRPTPALARAVMPILRDRGADPELFANAYLFLEENVSPGGWRSGARRDLPVLDEEVPELAAAIDRWYRRGA
ncbi:MAG: tetratricopeptide repeat protein, partial [Planctomycetota bacterium]